MAASQSVQAPPDSPPQLVLDTNAVLDGWVFCDAAMAPAVRAIEQGAARWIATARMRQELARALAYPELVRWAADSEHTLAAFDRWARLCADPPPRRTGGLHCTDPDDQPFIDLALAHRARWLLTRDKALLRLAKPALRAGTHVCRPAAFAAP